MDLNNKNIVITGASKGMGRQMALKFSQRQANVILVARTKRLLNTVKKEIQKTKSKPPLIIPCDISSEKEVDNMASIICDQYQQIDVLVNNAGFGTFQKSKDLSNKEMRRHFEVNFFGVYYCTKALLPLIKNSQSGYILNIGSYFSKLSRADNSVYSATKFALDGFSRGLRQELKPSGIKVGLFMPGPVDTPFHLNRVNTASQTPQSYMRTPEKAVEQIEKMIRHQKAEKISPFWMFQALRLKLAFS